MHIKWPFDKSAAVSLIKSHHFSLRIIDPSFSFFFSFFFFFASSLGLKSTFSLGFIVVSSNVIHRLVTISLYAAVSL